MAEQQQRMMQNMLLGKRTEVEYVKSAVTFALAALVFLIGMFSYQIPTGSMVPRIEKFNKDNAFSVGLTILLIFVSVQLLGDGAFYMSIEDMDDSETKENVIKWLNFFLGVLLGISALVTFCTYAKCMNWTTKLFGRQNPLDGLISAFGRRRKKKCGKRRC